MCKHKAPVGELRQARKARRWTIEDAAYEVEVDPKTYRRWEQGQEVPHPRNRRKLEQAFGMSIRDLGISTQKISIAISREGRIRIESSRKLSQAWLKNFANHLGKFGVRLSDIKRLTHHDETTQD